MHARSFRFDSSRLHGRLHGLFAAPRKPRTPALRALFGVVGVALLALLVFFGLFVGAAMLTAGLAWRLLARRGGQRPQARPDRIVDAEYRVVDRQRLPGTR
ncbi:hypothetical protein [Pseudoxanthomonas koreensis]|uniref:hypothetical protein n=1 Tax=Pseudoxanthomonas koreensis TaxID=266061 RepID=UPI001390B909|nr:hypothetical protein [Pseudoxanthomonas koreensis]KAF1694259.1 hypothetical protein CSC64_04360 [Pseudoxanthomonas koreensis]